MSDRWVLSKDPREGEWPEPVEWCDVHGLRRDSCGPCAELEIRELSGEELMAAAFVELLNRLRRSDDEAMGAHYAARFDQKESE